MAGYNELIFGDSWKDLGIVKVEEDDQEDDDDISKPEDLSIKTRSISIQTEDCMQAMIGSYFPNLSLQQLGTFLEVLSNILARTTEEQSPANLVEVREEEVRIPASLPVERSLKEGRPDKSGWISLEPDFVTRESIKEDSAKVTYSEESKIRPTTTTTTTTATNATEFDIEDIKLEAPYSDSEAEDFETVEANHSFEIKKKQTLNFSSSHLRDDAHNHGPSGMELSSPSPVVGTENNEGSAKMRTVTAFVPYRIKRVSPVRGVHSAIRSPQTRDERMVKNMKIPFSVDFIINSSTEQFNEFNINLNEEQRNLCRDIRRRGKNKIAAQNCRKRKVEQISSLEEELEVFSRRKELLRKENAELGEIHKAWKKRIAGLENHILESGIENIPRWLSSNR